MFNLGFTMEELMFPENFQTNFLFNIESNCFMDKFDEILPIDDYQEQIIINDDDDDDWFTIKQLNPDISSNDNISDQILPLRNTFSDNTYLTQGKSMVELDGTITALILPNLSIKITRDKNNSSSSSSDIVPTNSSSSPSDQQLLKTLSATTQQQQSNKHLMSKSTSSLSFCTQSSTSMTSNSADEISLNSNDFNEISIMHHSTDSMQKFSHHHKRNSSTNDNLLNVHSRRRRKRTIFSAADIEHLKEAFIQNPKPSQQDIAILSEQLGHDSYVIRVWFYNKRQATKKQIN